MKSYGNSGRDHRESTLALARRKAKLIQALDLELEQFKEQDRDPPTPRAKADDETRAPIAREKALAAGKPNAFVTYLPKPDEIAEM